MFVYALKLIFSKGFNNRNFSLQYYPEKKEINVSLG